jgi:hypothetical protein
MLGAFEKNGSSHHGLRVMPRSIVDSVSAISFFGGSSRFM